MKPADNLFFAATLYPPFYPPQRAGYRWTGQDVKGHIPQYKKVDNKFMIHARTHKNSMLVPCGGTT